MVRLGVGGMPMAVLMAVPMTVAVLMAMAVTVALALALTRYGFNLYLF